MTDDIIHKDCSKCGRNLPLSEFTKDRHRKDGLNSRCRDCVNANSRRYNKNNRAKIAARKKAYHEENRDELLPKMREYHAANRDRSAERRKAHRRAHPEMMVAQAHRRRSKIAENGGTLTAAEIKAIVAEDCFWCGIDCSQDFHLDHIVPISKGGRNSRCNVAVSCPGCNLSKNAKDLSDWLREIGWKD